MKTQQPPLAGELHTQETSLDSLPFPRPEAIRIEAQITEEEIRKQAKEDQGNPAPFHPLTPTAPGLNPGRLGSSASIILFGGTFLAGVKSQAVRKQWSRKQLKRGGRGT